MLFLKEFWNGGISPGEGRYHTKQEYGDAWKRVEQAEEGLKKHLSSEDWELFAKFQEAQAKADDIEYSDIFIEGFRMGAKVILDVLLKTA